MNKTEIMNKITKAAHKTGFAIKQHSPEILAVTGTVGVVASAVIACKATTKVNDIISDAKTQVHDLHLVCAAAGIEEPKEKYSVEDTEKFEILKVSEKAKKYTVEDSRKDLTLIYIQTGMKFIKLYAPAIILGAASLSCLLASNNILRKRNAALAAAYATIDSSFKEYRNRVIDRFGEEVDKELKYNVKAQEIEETVTDKNGKEKTVKKTVKVANPNEHSEYARFFDDGCTGWEKNSEYNLMFLNAQQNYANDLLKAKGYLFLNEVYDMLGIPKTKAGQVVGWVYDPDNPNSGDNYVDFGIYDAYNEKARDFVNGYERTILLDFNVDGYILDKSF